MSIDDLYLEHFGLSKHPFRLTPDADFLYLSSEHARAKACVEQASVQRGAVALVTGEIGCGKSLLINRIMADMPSHVTVGRLTQTDLNVDEFLQALLSQFGFRPFDRGKVALRSLLDSFLFAQSMREQRVLLIIEEAQNLSQQTLRELCELSDLEEDGVRLISVVLVGQPRLRERYGENELKRLVERARCQVHLEPLNQRDTKQFIRHRMRVAGCNEPPFEQDTYAQIFQYTGGVPRVIVNLCDTALTAAFVEESDKVTPALLEAAIEELSLKAVAEPTDDDDEQDGSSQSRRAMLAVAKKGRHIADLEINDTRVMIGRDPDNDVLLQSEFISRHHAQISMDLEGRYWIKDLNSTNGVFINGRRTQRGMLHDGDSIKLGHHTIVFRDKRDDSEAESAAATPGFGKTTVLDVPPLPEEDEPQVSSGHS